MVVPDGAADEPLESLSGSTPLQSAITQNIDTLTITGRVGAAEVTPPDMYPGSDAANMALLGYNPVEYYTGRGPVEAAALNVPMSDSDVAFRCSLISTDGYRLLDYSSGHITTEEAAILIDFANQELGTDRIQLFPGISYRHILRWTGGDPYMSASLPHENMGKLLSEIYPTGAEDNVLRRFITQSFSILNTHPVNVRRRREGKNPANMLWPWGPGKSPALPPFQQIRGMSGAVVAAVDVVKGLGRLAGLEVPEVPGATGYFDTDYASKANTALEALKRHDFVWIHVEAPDEAGHLGSLKEKILAIENIDRLVIGTLLENLHNKVDFRLLCVPDHKTPLARKGHSIGPVPYLLYDSRKALNGGSSHPFDERILDKNIPPVEGFHLIEHLFDA